MKDDVHLSKKRDDVQRGSSLLTRITTDFNTSRHSPEKTQLVKVSNDLDQDNTLKKRLEGRRGIIRFLRCQKFLEN